MTARCGGGTSATRPGVAQQNVVGGALITEGLAQLSPWLIPAAALIDGFMYEATNQCSGDPPPMPVWDASDAEIIALGLLAPTAQQTLTKINNLLLNWAWDQFCTCTGGVTPTPTPTPAPPPSTTSPSVSTTQACFVGSYNDFIPVIASSTVPQSQRPDLFPQLFGRSQSTQSVADGGGSYLEYSLDNRTSFTFQYKLSANTQSSTSYNPLGRLVVSDANLLDIAFWELERPDDTIGQGQWQFTFPSNARWLRFETGYLNNDATYGRQAGPNATAIQVYCGGQNPTSLQSCCPPDPALTLAVQNLIQLVQNLAKPAKPSYTKGTVHTGITGAGTLAISGLAGVLVDITTGVPTNPQLPGTPPYEFSVGWMSVSDPDGMIDEKRITRQHQVWISGLTPYATVFGYYLNAGFTINVTELLPV